MDTVCGLGWDWEMRSSVWLRGGEFGRFDVSNGVLLSLISLLPLLHIWCRIMNPLFFFKYPTSRTYVSPLTWLPELLSNPILRRATAKASSQLQTHLTPSRHPHHPRTTNVHQLTLKLGLPFLYCKILPMGWTPRTKMKRKTIPGGGSGIRDGA